MAIVGVAVSAAAIALGSHRFEAIPMTIVALLVAALAFRRSRRPARLPSRRRILAAALRYIAALLILMIVVLNAAFIEISDPVTNSAFEEIFLGPPTPDFSHLSWLEAFEKCTTISLAHIPWERGNEWTGTRSMTQPHRRLLKLPVTMTAQVFTPRCWSTFGLSNTVT